MDEFIERNLAEFKERNSISNEEWEQVKLPTPRLYNIHKRSLPIAIDKIVVIGVTKEEAVWWCERRLKAEQYFNNDEDTKTLIYYDIIPVDAKAHEHSVYYNDKPVTYND